MNPVEVLTKYGSQYNFHKVTGMSQASLGNWLRWGYVPENSQYKLERLTNGELKAKWPPNDFNDQETTR
jgi:hypothetical protein